MAANPSDASDLDHQARTGRAFLVHLRADADVQHGEFQGRVQHVRSGDAAHFESLDELATFVTACVEGESE